MNMLDKTTFGSSKVSCLIRKFEKYQSILYLDKEDNNQYREYNHLLNSCTNTFIACRHAHP